MKIKKWEYAEIYCINNLNEMGQEGWELVCYVNCFIFKRPLEEEIDTKE